MSICFGQRSFVGTAILTAALLGMAVTASAQDHLYALVGESIDLTVAPARSTLLEIDTAPGSLGRATRRLSVPGAANDDITSVGAGRYLAWTSGVGSVRAFDTVTGATAALAIPGASRLLAGDPGKLRVFVQAYDNIVILDAETLVPRVVTLPAGARMNAGAYLKSSDRLYVVTTPQAGPGVNLATMTLYMVNATSGAIEGAVALGDLQPQEASGLLVPIEAVAIDHAATRLFVETHTSVYAYALDGNGEPTLLHRFPRPNTYYPTSHGFQLDEARRRVTWTIGEIVQHPVNASAPVFTPGIAIADLDTLAPLGTLIDHSLDGYIQDISNDPTHYEQSYYSPLRYVQAPRSPSYVLTAVGPKLNSVFSGKDPNQPAECGAARLAVLDPNSGVLQQQANLLDTWGRSYPGACSAQLVLQAQPAAPALTAGVQGPQVTLSWTGIDDATHYDLEAGSAPGLANLFTSLGNTGTSLTVTGVPPGTYYVRVRAVNWVGRSLPSTDVQVVVH